MTSRYLEELRKVTEEEFKSGKMADGTRLMQPECKLEQFHAKGVASLLAHFCKMQEMASAYIEPSPYVGLDGNKYADSSKGEILAFANDMVYMLDGPEQRAAQAEAEKCFTIADSDGDDGA